MTQLDVTLRRPISIWATLYPGPLSRLDDFTGLIEQSVINSGGPIRTRPKQPKATGRLGLLCVMRQGLAAQRLVWDWFPSLDLLRHFSGQLVGWEHSCTCLNSTFIHHRRRASEEWYKYYSELNTECKHVNRTRGEAQMLFQTPGVNM